PGSQRRFGGGVFPFHPGLQLLRAKRRLSPRGARRSTLQPARTVRQKRAPVASAGEAARFAAKSKCVHLNFVHHYLHFERGDAGLGWRAEIGSRRQIETGAVPGAGKLPTFAGALRERSTAVRAIIFQRKKLAAGVKHCYLTPANYDSFAQARRD